MKLKGLLKNGELTASEYKTPIKIPNYEKVEPLQYNDIEFAYINKL
ncbi:hypothetical protein CLU97_2810 [Chryseobacterium sp. 7]|nr:hypothetical protein CLU97_2810 [Chryseobacterium sp. 7]